MSQTRRIWSRGDSPPADLQDGTYDLEFALDEHSARAVLAALDAVGAWSKSYWTPRGRLEPITGYVVRDQTGNTALILTVWLEGIPWSALALILATMVTGVALYAALREVRQIVSTPAGSVVAGIGGLVLLGLIVSGLLLFLNYRKKSVS